MNKSPDRQKKRERKGEGKREGGTDREQTRRGRGGSANRGSREGGNEAARE